MSKFKISIFVILILILVVSVSYAKNYNADGRAQNPSGNWVPIQVDASGNLKVVSS